MRELDRKLQLLFGALLAIALLLSPTDAQSSSTPANELFVGAVTLHRQSAALSPAERDAKLREVRDLFDRILAEHPDSDVAKMIRINPAPAGVVLADLPPSQVAGQTPEGSDNGTTSALETDHQVVQAAERAAARLCEDAVCRESVTASLVEWAIENAIDGTLDEAFTRSTEFVVDEIVLAPELRQTYLKKMTDWPATLRPAAELGGDVVYGILTMFVGEWLAQGYEDKGYQSLAVATRAGFSPLVSTLKATWTAKAAAGTAGGLLATNIVLWSHNLMTSHKLGEALLADDAASRDIESQLVDIQGDIASIHASLAGGRKTGQVYPAKLQGDPLTAKEKEILESNLEQFQASADKMMRSDFLLNDQWLTGSVARVSKWLASSIDELREPTDLHLTTPAVAPFLNITLSDSDGFSAQIDTLAPPAASGTEDRGAWAVQTEPDLTLRAGEQGRGFAVSADGAASFRGTHLFAEYRAPEPDYQPLAIFIDDAERRAVALFMRDGAERMALVDLEDGVILNDAPRPFWRYGPTDDVIWGPSDRYAALRLPMAEFSTGLGIFELSTGQYATIPNRAFDANALDTWLADSLKTRSDGAVVVEVALEKLDAHGTPLPSDGTPPETRILDLNEVFDGPARADDVPPAGAPGKKTVSLPGEIVQAAGGSSNSSFWGPDIVVPDSVELGYRPCGDASSEDAKRSCLEGMGLPQRAIDFSFDRIHGDLGGEVFATEFWELGRVDLAITEFQGASPVVVPAFLNGEPDIKVVGGLGRQELTAFADGTSQEFLRAYPGLWSSRPVVKSHRLLRDGRQRFIVEHPLSECRACDIIGIALVAHEFGTAGRSVGQENVGVVADAFASVSAAVMNQQPRALQYALNLIGYDAGPMDGAVGPRTAAALREFQADYCLPASGALNSATADALATADGFERPPCARQTLLLAAAPSEPESQNEVRDGAHATVRTIRGFGNQGLDFTMTVSLRRVAGGVRVRLEDASGRHRPGATFNPVETDDSFSMGFHVVARKSCDQCKPHFVQQSPPGMRYEAGEITPIAHSLEIFVPNAELEAADFIGVALYGGNTLFLAPGSDFAISEIGMNGSNMSAGKDPAAQRAATPSKSDPAQAAPGWRGIERQGHVVVVDRTEAEVETLAALLLSHGVEVGALAGPFDARKSGEARRAQLLSEAERRKPELPQGQVVLETGMVPIDLGTRREDGTVDLCVYKSFSIQSEESGSLAELNLVPAHEAQRQGSWLPQLCMRTNYGPVRQFEARYGLDSSIPDRAVQGRLTVPLPMPPDIEARLRTAAESGRLRLEYRCRMFQPMQDGQPHHLGQHQGFCAYDTLRLVAIDPEATSLEVVSWSIAQKGIDGPRTEWREVERIAPDQSTPPAAITPASRTFATAEPGRAAIEAILAAFVGQQDDTDLLYRNITPFTTGLADRSAAVFRALGEGKAYTVGGSDAGRADVLIAETAPERHLIHYDAFAPDVATAMLGEIADLRVLEVRDVTGSDCEWEATYRTWLAEPTQFAVAVAAVTGRDGFTHRACFRTTREGYEIVRKRLADF